MNSTPRSGLGAELSRVLRVMRSLDAALTLVDHRAQSPEESTSTMKNS